MGIQDTLNWVWNRYHGTSGDQAVKFGCGILHVEEHPALRQAHEPHPGTDQVLRPAVLLGKPRARPGDGQGIFQLHIFQAPHKISYAETIDRPSFGLSQFI
jgi:hypothetical protein